MSAAWTPPPAHWRIPSPTPGSASSDLIHPRAHADAWICIHGCQIEAGAHRRPPLPSSVTARELGSGWCASGALWWCLQYVGMPTGVRSGRPCAMAAAASPTSNLPSTSECGSPPLRLLLLPPTSLRCRPVRPRLLCQQPNSCANNRTPASPTAATCAAADCNPNGSTSRWMQSTPLQCTSIMRFPCKWSQQSTRDSPVVPLLLDTTSKPAKSGSSSSPPLGLPPRAPLWNTCPTFLACTGAVRQEHVCSPPAWQEQKNDVTACNFILGLRSAL
nr:uncharacterized protein LOC123494356 [Aegilops tauschii subsp. strangulata]